MTVELHLIDVAVRHGLGSIGLEVDDFRDPFARACWAALLDLWARDETPTVEGLVDQLVAREHAGAWTAAREVLSLPCGYRADVEDYIALIAAESRRRQALIALEDAQRAIARGADPDAVLRRLHAQPEAA